MTKHFTDAEVACKCGCGMLPAADFMDKLETLRELFNAPMPVTSGARCPAHNELVSQTGRHGPHTTGRAIDIAVSGADALRLVWLAQGRGFTGIGVSQKGKSRFIHLDDLPNSFTTPRPFIWSY